MLLSLADDLFHVGVPVIEKVIRPVMVYIFLVICLRVFGKRELAQLNPFDLVVLLSLSNTVQNAIIGKDDSVLGGLIGAFTLLAVNYAVVRFRFGHRRIDRMLEGKPAVLVENGHVLKRNMAKEVLTQTELMTVLHRQGFDKLEEVQRCVLEPGGGFSIERKEPTPAALLHAEVLARLDAIGRQIQELKGGGKPLTEPRS